MVAIHRAVDQKLEKLWYPLEPKFNIFGLNRPYEVTGNIAIPKPVIASISNWLDSE